MTNRRKWTRARSTRPPDGRVRQSQVVSTFGPGSMLDLLNDAVLVGGLDFWRLKGQGEVVNEPRLLEIVEPLYHRNKWPLSKEAPFRKPPLGMSESRQSPAASRCMSFRAGLSARTPTAARWCGPTAWSA